jgi:outer membrane immunogenic protein
MKRELKRALMATAGAFALAIASQPSIAADIPTKATTYNAPVAAQMFDWTGFYVGAQGGYGWFRAPLTVPGILTLDTIKGDGWFGGGTLGYNLQRGQWVVGVEGDLSWADLSGNTAESNCSLGPDGCRTTIDWFGTLRARAGILISPTALVYATGGFAWAGIEHRDFIGRRSDTKKSGWTIGGGVEAAIGGNWTAKAEYLYLDFGRTTAATIIHDHVHAHILRVGLNYRFATGKSPEPVMTKY